jgi:aminopeptidase N
MSKQRMFNSLMMLAVEANGVVALRMMKLLRGGKRARREAQLMVNEKIAAAWGATASLMAGASGDEIVRRYRQHVAANARRLKKSSLGGSRKRAGKPTGRRPKS